MGSWCLDIQDYLMTIFIADVQDICISGIITVHHIFVLRFPSEEQIQDLWNYVRDHLHKPGSEEILQIISSNNNKTHWDKKCRTKILALKHMFLCFSILHFWSEMPSFNYWGFLFLSQKRKFSQNLPCHIFCKKLFMLMYVPVKQQWI